MSVGAGVPLHPVAPHCWGHYWCRWWVSTGVIHLLQLPGEWDMWHVFRLQLLWGRPRDSTFRINPAPQDPWLRLLGAAATDNRLSSSLSARIDVSGKILQLMLIWHLLNVQGRYKDGEQWLAMGGDKSRIFHIWFHRLDGFFFPIGLWFCYIYLCSEEAISLMPFVLWPNST